MANALARAGREEGRPGRHLHADDPRAARRDARLRTDRRAPLGRLRRLQRGRARRPHRRRAVHDSSSPPTAATARGKRVPPQGDADDAMGAVHRSSTASSSSAPATPSDWRRAATTGGTSSPTARRPTPAGADGLRGPPLPALHLRHDGQAEGDHAHHRRLPGRHRATHRLIFDIKPDDVYWCMADIGWVTGHCYIVYGPLANATTGIIYEGARLPRQGPMGPDRRELPRHHPVHRPDRHPRPDEVRARAVRARRPLVAAAARLGRRADQPRGVGLVLEVHRRGARARWSTPGGRPRPA